MKPIGTSPIVPVREPDESIRFYTGTLGFEQVFHNKDHGYALFRRGEALIAVGRADDEAALAATGKNIAAQIWVEDVDAVWDELKDGLLALPEGRVRAPFDRTYGVREFHVKDPDGFLMFFSEA